MLDIDSAGPREGGEDTEDKARRMGRGQTRAALHEAETEARRAAISLEAQGKLMDGFTEHFYPLTAHERAQLQRYRVALELARDLDACRALLAGQPVDPARLDQAAVRRAQKPRLVQLVPAIDLLETAAV